MVRWQTEATCEIENWGLVEHATQGNRGLAVTVEAETELFFDGR